MDKYDNCQINKQPKNKATKIIKFKFSKKDPKFDGISSWFDLK